jgi:hypothetical protein
MGLIVVLYLVQIRQVNLLMEGKHTYARQGLSTVEIKGAVSVSWCTVMLVLFVLYTGTLSHTVRVKKEAETKRGFPN